MYFYRNTKPARFLRRLNRFVAEVEINENEQVSADRLPAEMIHSETVHVEQVHVKNTGRLRELLLPGAVVMLQETDNPDRITRYDLISVYKDGLGWVNIDSLMPNTLVRQALEEGILGANASGSVTFSEECEQRDGRTDGDQSLSLFDHVEPFDLVKPEYTYGNSRFDFYMEKRTGLRNKESKSKGLKDTESKDNEVGIEKYLIEVKGCTLANDQEPGTGLFPDAPTERGIKHLRELIEASGRGYHCCIAFVIQMNGITRVLPNEKTHPEFAQALKEAEDAGVQILYLPCEVEADRIQLSSTVN